jgi:hypothetical protein
MPPFYSHTKEFQHAVQRTERITVNESPTSDSFWMPATRLVWNPQKNQCRSSIWSAVKSVVEPGMVCTTPSNAASWHRARCMSRDMMSQPVLVFHDVIAGLAWSLALDRVKCAIKWHWKIISMVSLRHFRIEIKPSASGLCWDTKTLSGVAKITSNPSANTSGFDYILALYTLAGFGIST